MAAKRFHDGYEQDPDQPDDKRMRRLPSFSTVIREAMMQKHMQNLFRLLEPLLRRVVKEELQAGLALSPRYTERLPEMPPVERPTWKLAFRNPPRLPIFTGSKIEDDISNPLEVILVNMDTGSPSALPQALRIELVPLFGEFPQDDREDWAADEFQKGIVKQREGKRPLLTGEVSLTMRDGRATVNELQFTDNSSWVRCRKFRIGVRVVPGSYDGPRILEAMTEAFVVRDHRGELYRKHYPPVLGDDVWRLEKIGKEGAFHRKLAQHRVKTVQEFLRMLTVKPDELRAILGEGMTDRMWEMTTNHARSCVPGDKVYAHNAAHCTIYVNSVFDLVKVEFGGVECPLHQLNKAQTNFVQQLILDAYEHRHSLQEADAVMLHGHAANNIPLLHNAAHVAMPAPADPTLWFQNNSDIDFPVVDDEVPVPQAANFAYQWHGQIFNMPG
ncbi:protein SAR DEFICIENT 1-like [Phragmites australis]|uniref:protein SAR DEFICIENT 1-like n=1 Tax=Phragmites australis TaxID=29695 RepID=UPI002D79A2ED|nr:protein SAR DEFICIENT 1-like [Phragmites australis]